MPCHTDTVCDDYAQLYAFRFIDNIISKSHCLWNDYFHSLFYLISLVYAQCIALNFKYTSTTFLIFSSDLLKQNKKIIRIDQLPICLLGIYLQFNALCEEKSSNFDDEIEINPNRK